MAALQIKNIPTGPGDDIKIDASWAKGDTKNVISTSAASPSFTMFGGGSRLALTRASASGRPRMLSGFRRPMAAMAPPSDRSVRCPWCVQPQLGSVLVDEPVRQLLGRFVTTAPRRPTSAPPIRTTARLRWPQRRLQLQPGLQRRAAWSRHPLDPGQEPDVLGRSHVVPPRPEVHWFCYPDARRLRSRLRSTSSRTRTPCPSTFALSVTSDPDRLRLT